MVAKYIFLKLHIWCEVLTVWIPIKLSRTVPEEFHRIRNWTSSKIWPDLRNTPKMKIELVLSVD